MALRYQETLTKGAKEVELENYPSEKTAYLEALEALLENCLITVNYDRPIIGIHRLIQYTVRRKLDLPIFRLAHRSRLQLCLMRLAGKFRSDIISQV